MRCQCPDPESQMGKVETNFSEEDEHGKWDGVSRTPYRLTRGRREWRNDLREQPLERKKRKAIYNNR